MKAGSEDESLVSGSSIELENNFIGRMELCADKIGSVSALAKKAGISQSGIRRYFSGGEPTRPHLAALAEAANVRLEWLATGNGDPENEVSAAVKAASAPPDLDSLEDVTTKVLELLEKHRPDISARAKARIVRLVYEFYLRQGEPMDEASLNNVIELAAFRY
jgi:transcriptional regulator with XRE-family HTH domain